MTAPLALEHLANLVQKWKAADLSTAELVLLAAILPIRLLKWRILGVNHSLYGEFLTRRELMDLAIAHANGNPGLWLEFGVFEGESINYIASHVQGVVYGFDSFQGLPSDWGLHFKRGAFSTGGKLPATRPNVRLLRGWFDESLPAFLQGQPNTRVAFLHVDSDLYQSARVVLQTLGDRVGQGTVVLFDEFCGMQPDDEARAFREFLNDGEIGFRYLGSSLEGGGPVAVEVLRRH